MSVHHGSLDRLSRRAKSANVFSGSPGGTTPADAFLSRIGQASHSHGEGAWSATLSSVLAALAALFLAGMLAVGCAARTTPRGAAVGTAAAVASPSAQAPAPTETIALPTLTAKAEDPALPTPTPMAMAAATASAVAALATPTADAQAPMARLLTVEEYPIVAADEDTPNHLEYDKHISPAILEKRQPWRSLSPMDRVAGVNQVLARFGYRLDATEKPGCPICVSYWLHQGDAVYRSDLAFIGAITVNDRGDDFVLVVEDEQGSAFLAQKGSLTPWDSTKHAGTGPVYAGDDLVTLDTTDMRQFQVKKGDQMIYSLQSEPRVDNPVKGLWAWQGHWVLEVEGQVIVDGQSLNQTLGYDEVFGWRIVGGQPFYFFVRDNRIGVSYAGQVLPQEYQQVIHYQCCEPAAYNLQGNESMVWGHAQRNGQWYYVEMGAYDPAAATPEAKATAVGPAPTAAPMPTTATIVEAGWQHITVPEQGVSFMVPANWQRQGAEWIWSLTGSAARLGFIWNRIEPGWQETAMLPNHAQTLERKPVELAWGKGNSYRLEIGDPAAAGGQASSFEQHVIIKLGDKVAYDFWASAASAENLAELEPLLEQMLNSVALAGG